MLSTFQNHINSKLFFLQKSRLLIAISGGIDSVILVHLCHKLKLNIALAHCNFNLRGKESDADEDFVLQLAEDLELEVFIESFDTDVYAQENKLSIQMAARKLRYDWFKEISNQLNFDYILTAHHADDNLETFLINFIRGTGLEGLTGIPEINNQFVRPLLPFSRENIETYAKQNHMEWREDRSNASTKYMRNKLRHQVIPILKEINPSLLQSFQSTINHLQGSCDMVDDHIESLIKQGITKVTPTGLKLNVAEIQKFHNPKAYLYRFLNEYGFTQWDDVANLLQAQSGKQLFSENWRLIKDRDYLLLSKKASNKVHEIIVSETEKQVETPFGILYFEDFDESTNNLILKTEWNTIFVDKQLLKFPLSIRKWEEGDVFYPLGMFGKKKLSKFFKDQKYSLLDKENTWLLCSQDTIVWVIEKRADNRFKVVETTKEILKIELKYF